MTGESHPPDSGNSAQTPPVSRRTPMQAVLRHARRLVILVIGSTVLLLGLIMLVTPGPGLVVIPIGLGILSLEFAWAQRLLGRVREGIQSGMDWRNWDEWKWMVGLRHQRPDRVSR